MSAPVRRLNVVRMLESHLPDEHRAITEYIEELDKQRQEAVAQRETLEAIAAAAKVSLASDGLRLLKDGTHGG